ncbi:MAG: hypothetical protein K8F91_17575, partial [Candidatus Obscuribacterales bacterium]|nr:hypothetical protein [Candidatus Obscuribacterales bacterium]
MRILTRLFALLLVLQFSIASLPPIQAAEQSKINRLVSSDLDAIISSSTVTIVKRDSSKNGQVDIKIGGILINPEVVEKDGEKHLVSDCAFLGGHGVEELSKDSEGDRIELK